MVQFFKGFQVGNKMKAFLVRKDPDKDWWMCTKFDCVNGENRNIICIRSVQPEEFSAAGTSQDPHALFKRLATEMQNWPAQNR